MGVEVKQYCLYRISKEDLKNKNGNAEIIPLYSLNTIDEIYIELGEYGLVNIVNS